MLPSFVICTLFFILICFHVCHPLIISSPLPPYLPVCQSNSQLFGVHVHSVVMEHLKKMTGSISNLGAALLARDVQELVATIKGFHLTKLDQLFGDLQALCNIFFVQPSSVRALLTEGSKLSKIDPQTIVDFIKLRADFASNKTLLMSQLSFVTPQH